MFSSAPSIAVRASSPATRASLVAFLLPIDPISAASWCTRRGEQRVIHGIGAGGVVLGDLVRPADTRVSGRVLIHEAPQLGAEPLGLGEYRTGSSVPRGICLPSDRQSRHHRNERRRK